LEFWQLFGYGIDYRRVFDTPTNFHVDHDPTNSSRIASDVIGVTLASQSVELTNNVGNFTSGLSTRKSRSYDDADVHHLSGGAGGSSYGSSQLNV
jgi:hypothetical protein